MTDILDALPQLTHAERRLLCRRALALDEEETDALQALESSAAEGFALLDRMEAEDSARGASR